MKNTADTTEALENALKTFSAQKVLVIGDMMLDRFIYGTVDRISPESDAPILDIRRSVSMPGGAGNVSRNLKTLGVQVTSLGVIGDDEAGKDLAALLGTDDLIVSAARPTTVKTRYVGGSKQLIRADHESRDDISAEEQNALLEKAAALIPSCGAVILSDYNKGVLTDSVIKSVIEKANEDNIPVLIDPKKEDYIFYKGAALLTPNRKELSGITGLPCENDEDITAAANRLMQEYEFSALIVTRSEDGMSVFEQGKEPVHLPNEAQSVTDVSGAGDTTIAVLATALAAGLDLPQAASLANKAGGLVVGKSATSHIDVSELEGKLKDVQVGVKEDPVRYANIKDWGQAAAQIDQWKKEGLTVGFTNGCFDILHYGHVNYLNQARDRCDRLVVGLNHDQSVKILKGPERPLHDEASRATVLGSLGSVDMVVFFGAEEAGQDNTPCALLEQIKPDLFVKGGDYTIDQLPEAKVMKKIGGRVELMSLYEGHSTTSTIEKMKKTGGAA